ncbi:anthranilate synthase component I family protein [Herbiconiux sp. A18JL235]|uniref:Anthranilate synthase component I family protein n=1 Tax=Herbiconiux sp. A18JL235 TaxID=3152363 RepID=A0AB39BCP7_9MICO
MPPTPLRRTLAVGIDPAAAFAALHADDPRAFWLDGGRGATAGMSYLGAAETVVEARSWSELRHLWPAPQGAGDGDPRRSGEPAPDMPPASDSAPPFGLGWVGWLEYELGTLDEELTRGPRAHPAGRIPSRFLLVERAVAIDHATGEVTLLALPAPDALDWFDSTERALVEVARASVAPAPSVARADTVAHPRHDFSRYAHLVEECRRVIAAGEAYQLCLTNTLDVPGRFDPWDTYLRLRELSPTAHGGYLRIDDTALLSASPELFLRVSADGRVVTRPVKGTRRRGTDTADDARLAAELLASEKERAENLMIVDLMRNDLARVCELGTVRVSELLAVETHPQVHQLVSTVEGRLRAGLDVVDALGATFPAGSMTGAPKRSAMRHLERFEGGERGVYSGAFGFLSFDGAAELAMVIRSVVVTAGGASVGTGGGITTLSVAAEEVEETRLKAAALLRVLGAVLPG